MSIVHWATRSVSWELFQWQACDVGDPQRFRRSSVTSVFNDLWLWSHQRWCSAAFLLGGNWLSTLYLIVYDELPSGWILPLWFAVPTIWTWQWPVCMHTCEDSLSTAHSVRGRERQMTVMTMIMFNSRCFSAPAVMSGTFQSGLSGPLPVLAEWKRAGSSSSL